MLIEITGWANYNPRSDVKHTTWFRLQNTFLSDPEFFDFTAEQKLIWIALLSEASRKQTGRVTVSTRLIAAMVKTTEDDVTRTIDAFKDMKILKYPRDVRVTRSTRPRTATERNVTERNEVATESVPSTDQSQVDDPDPPRKRAVYKFAAGDMRAAVWLQSQIVASNPRAVKARRANLDAWANEFRLMQADGVDMHDVAEVLTWVFEVDDFWRANVQSPVALRRSWDKIPAKMGAEELRVRRSMKRSSAWDIPQDRTNMVVDKPRPGDIVAE